ncbi:hypothetical protein [Streptomyces sp. NPDC004589]|uniref:hypothetical protein n=1 Tax=Streptomyces sp. NPDC004589 TaxID=3154553 RepID=UPI00339FD2C3
MVRDKGIGDVGHSSDDSGASQEATADTALDATNPCTATSTVGVCPWADDGPLKVIELCRCDDTNGDEIPDTDYVALVTIDETSALSTLGTYTADLTGAYAPVSPVDCDRDGALGAVTVQVHRVEVAAGSGEVGSRSDWR